MKTITEVFEELTVELRKRKFLFQRLNPQEHSFEAHHPSYIDKKFFIRAQEHCKQGLVVTVSLEDGSLPSDIQNEIMRGYLEIFDINEKGAVELCIPYELQANRDMCDVANVLTRAYGLAVTA